MAWIWILLTVLSVAFLSEEGARKGTGTGWVLGGLPRMELGEMFGGLWVSLYF
jgi:hypothetical protein